MTKYTVTLNDRTLVVNAESFEVEENGTLNLQDDEGEVIAFFPTGCWAAIVETDAIVSGV